MDDPRVTVVERDLYEVIANSQRAFDVILNDVDNGPGGCALDKNERLYRPEGLAAIRWSSHREGCSRCGVSRMIRGSSRR